jgi:glycosyltransferase involved in cell wall biosynthesis
LPRVELVPASAAGRPERYGVPPAKLLDLVERLDRDRHFDAIIIRAFTVAALAVDRPTLAGRLWSTYVVEPERDVDDPAHRAELSRIARRSRWLVAQSQPMRELTERVASDARGKVILLPPGIPGVAAPRVDPDHPVGRIVYLGKLHPFYSIPAVVAAFRALREEEPALEMELLGDKIDGGPLGPAWAGEVADLLRSTPGLAWHGAVPREEVAHRLAEGGVAVSCWDYRYGTRMNDLVVSTKLLDYAAVGMPIVLNRTQAQVSILGADYPLFIDGPDDLRGALRRALGDPAAYREASLRTYEAARAFTYESLAATLRPLLHAEAARHRGTGGTDPAGPR